jgi:hypothetical protein
MGNYYANSSNLALQEHAIKVLSKIIILKTINIVLMANYLYFRLCYALSLNSCKKVEEATKYVRARDLMDCCPKMGASLVSLIGAVNLELSDFS